MFESRHLFRTRSPRRHTVSVNGARDAAMPKPPCSRRTKKEACQCLFTLTRTPTPVAAPAPSPTAARWTDSRKRCAYRSSASTTAACSRSSSMTRKSPSPATPWWLTTAATAAVMTPPKPCPPPARPCRPSRSKAAAPPLRKAPSVTFPLNACATVPASPACAARSTCPSTSCLWIVAA